MSGLFLTFFEISVSVGLAAFILFFAGPFLNRRYAAKWQYWIWVFLALRLLVPFGSAHTLLQERVHVSQEADSGKEAQTDAAPGPLIVTLPQQVTAPLAVSPDEGREPLTVLDVLAFFWLGGALLFAAVHLWSGLRFHRQLMREGRSTEDGNVLLLLNRLKRELHIRGNVPVVVSDRAKSPMVAGFFRQTLVLPADPCSSGELYFILKHELVHWKRRDVYVKLLFVAANAVHWFNPAVYLMRRAAEVDMELSCDEQVTLGSSYGERRAYTETLLAAVSRQCEKRSSFTTQFHGGKDIMKKRFRNILNENRKKSGWYLLVAAALLTVSLGALIGCSAAREQPQESPDPLRGTQAAGTQSMDGGTESGGQEYPDSQSGNSDRQENPGAAFAQMAGAWRIDFDRTDPTLWGTGISYGDALEITETGALTYYIGIGVGGTGQCTEQDGGVTVEITPYEEHGAEQEILTLRYGNEGGAETIWMDWHGEDVYWVRSSVHAPSESIADSEEAEAFRAVVEGFVTAYFSGDAQTVASYLAGTCEQGAEVYEGEHEAADITVKGLPETDAELTEGRWNVSVEFREGAQADSFWYLTIGLIREPDGWKVQFYGLEG